MPRKLTLNDLWNEVTTNYNRSIETGKAVFKSNARKYYAKYKALGGKRKFPTKYSG